MSKKNRPQPGLQNTPERLPPIIGIEGAPVIFTDGVISYGTLNGVIQLLLACNIPVPVPDNSVNVMIKTRAVAHVRLTPRAAQSMIDAIRGASELLAAERQRVLEERKRAQVATAKKAPLAKAPSATETVDAAEVAAHIP